MKIKMLTTKCGPVTSENWKEGQVRTVCDEEGEYWIKMGVATFIEASVVAPPEVAIVKAPEKAVVTPPETAAKGKVTSPVVKPPVAPPALPVVVNQEVPEWGKK